MVVPEPARDEVNSDAVLEGHERGLLGDRAIHFATGEGGLPVVGLTEEAGRV